MTIDIPKRLAMLASALAISLSFTSSPAVLAAVNDDGIWTVFTTSDAFGAGDDASRWHYWFDAQARYVDLGSGISQYLVRPGIGYKFGANLSAWVGYARLKSENRTGIVIDENRYWQQLSWNAAQWDDSTLSMRARLEQRSLSNGNDLGVVLRVLAKYVRPIGNDGKRYLTLGIEPFIDLNDTDWGGDSGFGQNRSHIGVGWRVTDRLTLEAGYMNQFFRVDAGEDRMIHLGVLNFKLKL